MSEFHSRLRGLLASEGIDTAAQFSAKVRVPRATAARLLKLKRAPPSWERLMQLTEALGGVRPKWLLRGKGPVRAVFTDEQFVRFAECWDALSEAEREEWMVFGEKLAKRKKKK
jgi:transcriptional regulator with XRE-family HTH domain